MVGSIPKTKETRTKGRGPSLIIVSSKIPPTRTQASTTEYTSSDWQAQSQRSIPRPRDPHYGRQRAWHPRRFLVLLLFLQPGHYRHDNALREPHWRLGTLSDSFP